MTISVKELVAPGRRVVFKHYRGENLYYEVEGTKFVFPVPIKDVGDGVFLAEDKAILFMRYIRIALVEIVKDAFLRVTEDLHKRLRSHPNDQTFSLTAEEAQIVFTLIDDVLPNVEPDTSPALKIKVVNP